MCIFSYAYFECNHRGEDHIDTSSCRYFAKRGIHCQEDSIEHRERPGGVEFSNKKERIPGRCPICIREDRDIMERAFANSMKTAKEEEDRRSREKEERDRAEEAARLQRIRQKQERADEIEKARLAQDEEKKRENKKRAAAAEKRRQEMEDKAKRDADRKAELKQWKADAERADKERQREQAEAEEDIKRQEELYNIEREKRAKHRQELRQKYEDANRRQAEREEAERQEAAEQEEELQRQRKEMDKQKRARAREAQEVKDREEAAKREADDELKRKLAPRRVASETQPTPAPATEQTQPIAKPTPPYTKHAVDISGVIGHHGTQELGHNMIGNRKVPIHESQRRTEPPKTPVPPPIKRDPLPMNRLSGTIASSPHDYKIQQPSLVATPGTPGPDWRQNVRKSPVSKANPAPEPTGLPAELAAKLAKAKAKTEQGTEETDNGSPEKTDSDWEIVNKPNTTAPAHSISSALQTPVISNSLPPTYPVVPPLAYPNIASVSPPPTAAKPKPPVPVKRISSTTFPVQKPLTSETRPTSQTRPIPTPPPISSLPNHLRHRVDSAAPSPQVGSKMDKSSDWDDSGSESEDEGQFGGDGAWDRRDTNVTKKAFSPDDVFGEQRRKGWKAA